MPGVKVAVLALVAVTLAQDFDFAPAPRPAPARIQPGYSGPSSKSSAPRPTPVPIIKQINTHNDDGSYTYGYESADGSFKIETKLPTGEVKGKYGYVDDLGKVRVIEYGATKYGFAPAGEGITVPPPTLVDETTDKQGALLPEYSGAYDQQDAAPEPAPVRAQSAISRPTNQPIFEFSSAPAPRPAPRPSSLDYSPPQTFEPAPRPAPKAQPSSYSFDFPSPSLPSKPAFSPATPPRPAFSNAAPAPFDDFGRLPSRPAPKLTFAQPAPLPSRPAPQPSFAPAPISRPVAPAPQYRPAPQPSAKQSGRAGGSILDQLSKDYALPQGNAAPLHDISFGYY